MTDRPNHDDLAEHERAALETAKLGITSASSRETANDLAAMAADPDIQREYTAIAYEFKNTEMDGLTDEPQPETVEINGQPVPVLDWRGNVPVVPANMVAEPQPEAGGDMVTVSRKSNHKLLNKNLALAQENAYLREQLASQQRKPQPEAGGDDDLLGCDHEDTQFLRSGSGMGNRELVRVCKRCGEIMVSGVKDGVGFNIQFHVDDPETIKLISKWSAYVWKDYPDMYPKTVKALEEQLASQQRELDTLRGLVDRAAKMIAEQPSHYLQNPEHNFDYEPNKAVVDLLWELHKAAGGTEE